MSARYLMSNEQMEDLIKMIQLGHKYKAIDLLEKEVRQQYVGYSEGDVSSDAIRIHMDRNHCNS
jgi:hypothetical protein